MRASCLLLTYNKMPGFKHLVEEAIQSFLDQDYADKELIIVNDTPSQFLYLDPLPDNVVLVNLPRRVRSLGEKCNIAAAMSTGDILLRWDDDDISLPWRISTTVKHLGTAAYWKPSHSFFMHGRSFRLLCGYMGACCIPRSVFEQIQGYPFIGVGEDQAIERRIKALDLKFVVEKLTPAEAFYIYRWGNGSTHVSGLGPDGYDKISRQSIMPGSFKLNPHWAEDHLTKRTRYLREVPDGRTELEL